MYGLAPLVLQDDTKYLVDDDESDARRAGADGGGETEMSSIGSTSD